MVSVKRRCNPPLSMLPVGCDRSVQTRANSDDMPERIVTDRLRMSIPARRSPRLPTLLPWAAPPMTPTGATCVATRDQEGVER